MINKVFKAILGDKTAERDAELYRNLIRHEAKIGGQLFGPVPTGHRREFFCLDEHTWVWHEEWHDKNGELRVQTTRYDLRPTGVVKSQNGHYSEVSRTEQARLKQAIRTYVKRVNQEIFAGTLAV